MTTTMTSPTSSHAGLLVPLDMFRITQLASIFGELLVGKARNVLDAQLVVTRHPEAPLFMMRIEGSVVADGVAGFWRENADLVQMASRAFPRQVIMYYVDAGATPADRREGFLVAQQGQVVAGDDASAGDLPADAAEADWPIAKLCQQLRIALPDLQGQFAGGPEVSVKLLEPTADDEALLQQLFAKEMAAQAAQAAGEEPPAEGATAAAPPPATATATADGAPPTPAAPPKPNAAELAAEDAKRRAREQAEETAAAAERAAQIQSGLRMAKDDLGITVAPEAELSEPDQLQPYIVGKLRGDLPKGVSPDLTQELQGKRIDVAVRVDFLSEVFIENTPMSKPQFLELAVDRTVAGKTVKVAEVLGPRLGYGTLVSTGKAPHVFVSRKLDLPLPEALVVELLPS